MSPVARISFQTMGLRKISERWKGRRSRGSEGKAMFRCSTGNADDRLVFRYQILVGRTVQGLLKILLFLGCLSPFYVTSFLSSPQKRQ